MIITMYRRKWKFSVMNAEDAENFIRQPHFERIRFISITEAMVIILIFISVRAILLFYR